MRKLSPFKKEFEMAINKTIFTADRTAQKEEIFNWLKDNAQDYFSGGISTDESGNIICVMSNSAELSFIFDETNAIYKIKTKTRNTYSIVGSSTLKYTKAGIVTSNGIMLIGALSSTADNILIISKTNRNTTAISMNASSASGANRYFSFIDLNNDAEWLRTENQVSVFSAPLTSFSPVCFASGNYCEHAFFTFFTQFSDPCVIQMNGKKYAYGGYLALEE